MDFWTELNKIKNISLLELSENDTSYIIRCNNFIRTGKQLKRELSDILRECDVGGIVTQGSYLIITKD